MESKKIIFIIGLCFSSTAFSSTNTGNNNVVQNKHNIIIIGHRGYPGVMPEETLPSYQAAATSGADYLELDLHMTKDCQLIARHNPWMKDNTNVAEVAKKNQIVASRKRTTPGRYITIRWQRQTENHGPDKYLSDLVNPDDYKSRLKALIVDGEDHTNDWSISDFTVNELKNWIRGTSYDAAANRPDSLNAIFPILTFQEVINIARQESKKTGRVIGIYPEVKNPVWNNGQAIANGCGKPGTHPYEDKVLAIIKANKLNSKDAPIIVQSFDPQSLIYLRKHGLNTKVTQLMDGNDVDYYSGKVIYNTGDYRTFVSGRPFSWTIAGKPDYFGEMLTPEGLKNVATYANIIGPWKMEIMTFLNSTKKGNKNDLHMVDSITPNNVITDAHKLGLQVHPFTFRNEDQYLAGIYHNNPLNEYLDFYKAGVDGVFTDFTPTAIDARSILYAIHEEK
ncbi:glycerophosphodiester phosphodiesterase [Salmonella enterica]|nr:glycerophosphodiester phosphodiesterase [Salmonella enterica]EJX3080054.1 glycerophosphodiester phosphodiesterase [Salmonella enterica]EJX3101048.1 glycerophosphodiester phosphodiesterase [Salmonella enterica]EJX3110891.1 glycerophosphodiester phosphodiesterase [Salmonella enterica]EJX3248024.1 glycerophosphodiester phosphodiesterase [Salmonella enterica]